MAGASVVDGVDRQINQDGVDNRLLIEQFGHSNEAGTRIFGTDTILSGINQFGDRNEIEIDQATGENAEDGSNVVGAIRQVSTSPLEGSNVTNRLVVDQSGAGAAGHYVGNIVQIFTGDGTSAANLATIAQTGGGLGQGNVLDALRQTGVGNTFTLSQDGQSNTVRIARQVGTANISNILQENEGNLVELSRQFGVRNSSIVRMVGMRNTIDQIYQDNNGWGTIGNTAEVRLVGDGNGGASVAAAFYSSAANAITAQGSIFQDGDQNDVSITIVGDDNRFGSRQLGDGNTALITIGRNGNDSIKANGNDSAIFQDGADNFFSHDVIGNGNVGAVSQEGDNNRVTIVQRGNGNVADVGILGDNNNGQGSFFTPGSSAQLVASLAPSSLQPGLIFQQSSTDLGNTAFARVTGSDNNFGFHQNGDDNVIASFINGGFNQLAVVQVGNGNTSLSTQTGAGNSLGVHQFR